MLYSLPVAPNPFFNNLARPYTRRLRPGLSPGLRGFRPGLGAAPAPPYIQITIPPGTGWTQGQPQVLEGYFKNSEWQQTENTLTRITIQHRQTGAKKVFNVKWVNGRGGAFFSILSKSDIAPPPVRLPLPAGYTPVTAFVVTNATGRYSGSIPYGVTCVKWLKAPWLTVPADTLYHAWAAREETLSASPTSNYIGKRTTFIDLDSGKTYPPIDWNEGSGAQNIAGDITKSISNTLAPVADSLYRYSTDLATGGLSEVIGLVDKNTQSNIESIVGGSQIGAVSGAATGFGASGGNPLGAIAGAVAGAVSGTVTGATGAIQNTSKETQLGQAIFSGLISGAVAGVGTAIAPASAALTPAGVTPIQGASFIPEAFVMPASTIASAGSTLLPSTLSLVSSAPLNIAQSIFGSGVGFATVPLPTPAGYAALESAGSTLLPPSLSLIPPVSPVSVIESILASVPGPNITEVLAPPPSAAPTPTPTPTPTPIDTVPLPKPPGYGAIDTAGSTILPPDLSLIPPVNPVAVESILVNVPGTTPGLLSTVLNAGKAAIPAATSAYKIYQALTAFTEAPPPSDLLFVNDPNYGQVEAPIVAKASYGLPLLAGAALLLYLNRPT